MAFRVNPASGVPLYLQLIEQVKHALEIGALRSGEQLPTIRKMAEDLVMNPNTVARAYRELERAGIIDVKHGTGAFISRSVPKPAKALLKAQSVVQLALERLVALGLSDGEIQRLVENELALLRTGKLEEGTNV